MADDKSVERASRHTDLPRSLGRREVEGLLTELADRLDAQGIEANINVFGGAAAAVAYYPDGVDRSMTGDVDGYWFPNDAVAAEAEAMAKEHGLERGWLNNEASRFVPEFAEAWAVTIERGAVTIRVASARDLLAMKLLARRPGRDDEDIAVLIRVCGITSLADARALVADRWNGEKEMDARGEAMVVAALGEYELTRSNPPTTLPPVEA